MEKQYKIIKPKHGYYKGECLDAEIAPTIDTGVGCWHTLIGESYGTENQMRSNRLTQRGGGTNVCTMRENDCEVGDTIDAFNKRVNKDGVSPTITTRPDGFKTAILPVTQEYRIRKLTEKECGRLMGVKSDDCEKIAKNQSTSSQYHLYGDSIVSTCLMAILGSLFNIDYETKINSLTDGLRK